MKRAHRFLPNSSEQEVTLSPTQLEYLHKHKRKQQKVHIYQFILLFTFIALWELLADLQIIDSFVFSSPSRVVLCFLSMTKGGIIFYHMGITLYETFVSFALVIILGILVSVLLWWNESVSKVLEPYLVVLNSLPKSALAPVFIVWLGNNRKTIIVAAVSVDIVYKVQLF